MRRRPPAVRPEAATEAEMRGDPAAGLTRSGTRHDTRTPGGPGVNPFSTNGDSGTGVADPSAPATGTEGWGRQPDEQGSTSARACPPRRRAKPRAA